MNISVQMLKALAAFAWISGAIMLFLKGSSMLIDALALQPDNTWPYGALFAGLVIGGIKARFIFIGSCRRNLKRINALPNPKVWQFYRPGFYIFLATRSIMGAILSRMASESYPLLMTMITVDFSLAIALTVSSYVFWGELKGTCLQD